MPLPFGTQPPAEGAASTSSPSAGCTIGAGAPGAGSPMVPALFGLLGLVLVRRNRKK
jgi:hypothetical protein